MLVTEESLTTNMGRTLAEDWKQWAMHMPNWVQGSVELAFQKFIEQKCRDVLNIAAMEPADLGSSLPELNKTMLPAKKADNTKVPRKVAMEDATGTSVSALATTEDGKRIRCQFVGSFACMGEL
jgi:hypothetical protein